MKNINSQDSLFVVKITVCSFVVQQFNKCQLSLSSSRQGAVGDRRNINFDESEMISEQLCDLLNKVLLCSFI